VNTLFGKTLRELRTERGLTQKQLGDQLYTYRSTINRWENGTRLPDATMIPRLARCLGVDLNTLFNLAAEGDENPNVIMVDDNDIVLDDGLSVLEEVLPNAAITGFSRPVEAVEFAKRNRVAMALLDIELGTTSGLELCRTLLEINPCTNVVFLTAYIDYAFDAWKTEAIGFMVKPLSPEDVREQLKKLRYPFPVKGDRGEAE
jgi:transcriptional regulator with XRE-family HTH domain